MPAILIRVLSIFGLGAFFGAKTSTAVTQISDTTKYVLIGIGALVLIKILK